MKAKKRRQRQRLISQPPNKAASPEPERGQRGQGRARRKPRQLATNRHLRGGPSRLRCFSSSALPGHKSLPRTLGRLFCAPCLAKTCPQSACRRESMSLSSLRACQSPLDCKWVAKPASSLCCAAFPQSTLFHSWLRANSEETPMSRGGALWRRLLPSGRARCQPPYHAQSCRSSSLEILGEGPCLLAIHSVVVQNRPQWLDASSRGRRTKRFRRLFSSAIHSMMS